MSFTIQGTPAKKGEETGTDGGASRPKNCKILAILEAIGLPPK